MNHESLMSPTKRTSSAEACKKLYNSYIPSFTQLLVIVLNHRLYQIFVESYIYRHFLSLVRVQVQVAATGSSANRSPAFLRKKCNKRSTTLPVTIRAEQHGRKIEKRIEVYS